MAIEFSEVAFCFKPLTPEGATEAPLHPQQVSRNIIEPDSHSYSFQLTNLYHLYKKSVLKVSNKMRTLTFTNNFAPPLQMIIVHPNRAALAMDGI